MAVRKQAVLSGIMWSLLDTFGGFVLKFFFALAITRILSPRDYGLVAYLGVFMAIANWMSEGGFGNALIQKKDADDTDFSTGFMFNVGVSIFFFLAYFFSAPLVAAFFNEPELVLLMRVLSIDLLLSSLCYIHLIKLIKQIQFKKQAGLNFSASLISGGGALYMAILGYGYWALVFQLLAGSVLKMLGLWYIVRWKPLFRFSIQSFRQQFRFGSKVFVSGLIDSISREIYAIFVGKSYQTAALGNFSRGQKFYDIFIVQTGTAFNKVLFPTMTKEKNEGYNHAHVYSRIYALLFFIMAPVSLFFFLMAREITQILLTDKWIGAVPYMKLFFLGGLIHSLTQFNATTVLSSNRPGLYLRMDLLQKALLLTALLATFRSGIETIIMGWLAVNYLYFMIYESLMTKLKYFPRGKYSRMLQVLLALVPGVALHFLIGYVIPDDFTVLMLNAFMQPVAYFLMMRLSGFSIYREFSEIIMPMVPKPFHPLIQIRSGKDGL